MDKNKVEKKRPVNQIIPISPYGFRFPTETEMAIDETLKLCGISGEDANMIAIEVMKKLGKSDEISACCRGLVEEKTIREDAETRLMSLEPERKKGKWIVKDDTERFIAQCNCCRYIEDSRRIKNFCPNCGAAMREVTI